MVKNRSGELSVDVVIGRRLLRPVFQPIASLRDASIVGYEALIRGPEGTALHRPDALFAQAAERGLLFELELACLEAGIRGFCEQELPGKLYLNCGAQGIERYVGERASDLQQTAFRSDVLPNRIVIELSEKYPVDHSASFKASLGALRELGYQLALDDFGNGYSSITRFLELQPETVKIDGVLLNNLEKDGQRIEIIRALARLAETFNVILVAEGIETEAQLAVLVDLGVQYGQGYFLGMPERVAARRISASARRVLSSRHLPVFVEMPKQEKSKETVEKLLIRAPSVPPDMHNDALYQMFLSYPRLHALAVVDEGQPVGLVNRNRFLDEYSKPFHRELFGRRTCTRFMNASPLMIEKSVALDSLDTVLVGEDQRYLSDGFIIHEAGRYLGIATGEQLVRSVTELRLESARHANPLTSLPGNIPITQRISRMLASGNAFVAVYFDLNNFKPFNDLYGYWKGDEMIKLAARKIARNCDPLRDFVGHVGGDDFVVLYQSENWRVRCQETIVEFNVSARSLFGSEELEKGGMAGEDRHGNPAFFPLTTIAAGAIKVASRQSCLPEEVASAAAAAKKRAKQLGHGFFLLDWEDWRAGRATDDACCKTVADCDEQTPGAAALP